MHDNDGHRRQRQNPFFLVQSYAELRSVEKFHHCRPNLQDLALCDVQDDLMVQKT